MVALLGRMHRAGVPIVAGTDGAGIEIVHELEIYMQAGFTPAEALAAATIVPARLVGREAKTGSLKVGKAADLALVDGDPSTRIGDLLQIRVVMLQGSCSMPTRCAARRGSRAVRSHARDTLNRKRAEPLAVARERGARARIA